MTYTSLSEQVSKTSDDFRLRRLENLVRELLTSQDSDEVTLFKNRIDTLSDEIEAYLDKGESNDSQSSDPYTHRISSGVRVCAEHGEQYSFDFSICAATDHKTS